MVQDLMGDEEEEDYYGEQDEYGDENAPGRKRIQEEADYEFM